MKFLHQPTPQEPSNSQKRGHLHGINTNMTTLKYYQRKYKSLVIPEFFIRNKFNLQNPQSFLKTSEVSFHHIMNFVLFQV